MQDVAAALYVGCVPIGLAIVIATALVIDFAKEIRRENREDEQRARDLILGNPRRNP